MVTEIETSQKYPDLKVERLSQIATEMRRVRHECVMLHQPENGDGNWSLGCRAFQRTCFAICELAKTVDWLTINAEQNALQFSFAIGSVPLRFYKGEPDEVPSRYLSHTDGESEVQLSFPFQGIPSQETILRLSIVIDATREVSAVHLVEVNEFKEVAGNHKIPFDLVTNVTKMQSPPVNLPPAIAEPRKREDTERIIAEGWNNAAAG